MSILFQILRVSNYVILAEAAACVFAVKYYFQTGESINMYGVNFKNILTLLH